MLKIEIDEAKDLIKGEDPNESHVEDLTTAIGIAEAIFAKTNADLNEVATATSDLAATISKFKVAKEEADFTVAKNNLINSINEARELITHNPNADKELTEYLKRVLANATEVFGNPDSTKANLIGATKNLQTAIKGIWGVNRKSSYWKSQNKSKQFSYKRSLFIK